MNILLAISSHFIGDFAFQSAWQSANKGKSWEVNFYHAATYTSIFFILGANWLQCLILLLSHFIIDPLKARYGIVKSIWLDQVLHFIVILVLFWR